MHDNFVLGSSIYCVCPNQEGPLSNAKKFAKIVYREGKSKNIARHKTANMTSKKNRARQIERT